jgi:hypothetical protein
MSVHQTNDPRLRLLGKMFIVIILGNNVETLFLIKIKSNFPFPDADFHCQSDPKSFRISNKKCQLQKNVRQLKHRLGNSDH